MEWVKTAGGYMSSGSCFWDTAERKQQVEPEVEQVHLSPEALLWP